jgi:orotate phosphoribosyltransferase
MTSFVYVRPLKKKNMAVKTMEGFFYKKGQNVVIVEDLISTGGGSLNAVLRRHAAEQILGKMAAILLMALIFQHKTRC